MRIKAELPRVTSLKFDEQFIALETIFPPENFLDTMWKVKRKFNYLSATPQNVFDHFMGLALELLKLDLICKT